MTARLLVLDAHGDVVGVDRRANMKLPAGQSCGGCVWFTRCSWLFGPSAENTECDWSPSRFRRLEGESK